MTIQIFVEQKLVVVMAYEICFDDGDVQLNSTETIQLMTDDGEYKVNE